MGRGVDGQLSRKGGVLLGQYCFLFARYHELRVGLGF